jgi:hypothetical protein
VVQEVPSPEDWVDRLVPYLSSGAATLGFSKFKFIMATKRTGTALVGGLRYAYCILLLVLNILKCYPHRMKNHACTGIICRLS